MGGTDHEKIAGFKEISSGQGYVEAWLIFWSSAPISAEKFAAGPRMVVPSWNAAPHIS